MKMLFLPIKDVSVSSHNTPLCIKAYYIVLYEIPQLKNNVLRVKKMYINFITFFFYKSLKIGNVIIYFFLNKNKSNMCKRLAKLPTQ